MGLFLRHGILDAILFKIPIKIDCSLQNIKFCHSSIFSHCLNTMKLLASIGKTISKSLNASNSNFALHTEVVDRDRHTDKQNLRLENIQKTIVKSKGLSVGGGLSCDFATMVSKILKLILSHQYKRIAPHLFWRTFLPSKAMKLWNLICLKIHSFHWTKVYKEICLARVGEDNGYKII